MFTNKDDRCPVREYVPIPGMPGNPWMFSNDDFEYMLNLDTRNSPGFMFNRNFYHSNESSLVLKERYPITLQAIAEGGASTIKLLIATVNVCGEEQTVGVADLSRDLYEYSPEDPYKPLTSDERLQTFVEIKDIYLNSRDTYFGRYIMLKPQFYSTEMECQVIKFSLWTSANTADPAASVPATSDQMLNYMIVKDQFGDDFLYLDPQTTGQYHFYVKGETISGKFTFIHYNVTAYCNFDEFSISAKNSFLEIKVAKNTGVQSLLSAAQLQGLFNIADSRCPITGFEIQDEAFDPINPNSVLYNKLMLSARTDKLGAVQLNTTLPPAIDFPIEVTEIDY